MEIFSIYPHTGEGIESLPAPEVPYYALAEEGLFLHRKTQIGNVLIKQTGMPKNAFLSKIGYKEGFFQWVGPKIPATIIAEATDFFRRIYRKHQTEAELLITMHNETGEFRLFVPFQRVNGAGVKSLYEPTWIDNNYTVVGTLHSHCNFSAFHSGTDSADAADMDGIHFTIGMLERDTPEIVAMVVMNKKEFHYDKPETVADIVFEGVESPEWWDHFVFPTTVDRRKPKRMVSITEDQWKQFCGMTPVVHTATAVKVYDHTPRQFNQNRTFGWYDDDESWGHYPYGVIPFQPTKASANFNKKFSRKKGYSFKITQIDKDIDKAIDKAVEGGFIRSEDWGKMQASEMDDITFWQNFYLDKMEAICEVLDIVNIEVEFHAQERTE